MEDIYAYSGAEIIRILGRRERKYRILLQMTQRELAERVGISLPTLQAFESGKSTDIAMSTLLRILRGIGQLDIINNLLPELPESPYLLRSDTYDIKRVRHK